MLNASNKQTMPFANNKLIHNNPHVYQKLNDLLQNNHQTTNDVKSTDLIKELLKPVQIRKGCANNEVQSNYNARHDILINAKNGKMEIIPKQSCLDKSNSHCLPAHKIIKGLSDNLIQFNQDLERLQAERMAENDQLEIEFGIDNYAKHKKTFESKNSFIKNLTYNRLNENNKLDCIQFYKQQEAQTQMNNQLMNEVFQLINDPLAPKNSIGSV